MVNQREQLKEKIHKDLQYKICNAQKNLTCLKEQIENFEKNSSKVRSEIEASVELICQKLIARKAVLLKEVQQFTQLQISNVQQEIENAYMELGSLQSTFANLDSFEISQLRNLLLPKNNPVQPGICTIEILKGPKNVEELLEKIEDWGRIENFLNPPNSKSREEIQVECISTSNESDKNVAGRVQDEEPFRISNYIASPSIGKWNIEEWLNKKNENALMIEEQDDFEMLSIEQLMNREEFSGFNGSEKVEDDDVTSSVSLCQNPPISDEKRKRTESELSSIVPVPETNSDITAITTDSMSIWLKPKKIPIDKRKSLVPDEMVHETACSIITSSKNKILDFPGLRLDPKCWLNRKNIRDGYKINLSLSEKEIIPPTFAALPYPFWLKKC